MRIEIFRLFVVSIFLFGFSPKLWAIDPKLCGQDSVQTIWDLSTNKNELKFRAKYRHQNSPFCEISIEGHNAEILLLDEKKEVVRALQTYLPMNFNQDFIKGKKMSGSSESLESVTVQMRFVDDEKFKTVKFIKIIQPDGKVYGPEAF
jgi:hypothetical protein